MKDFLSYLKTTRCAIVTFLCCACLYAAVFFLYRLPMGAAVYPLLLSAFLCAVVLGVRFRRHKRHMDALRALNGLPPALMQAELPVPVTPAEARTQALVRTLAQENVRLTEEARARYDQMVRYYTLWAHQIKTPLAAMRLHVSALHEEQARTVGSEMNRIEQYADMVLAYMRLGEPGADYVFRACELDSVVRVAVRRFAGEFIGRKIRLAYQPLNAQAVTDEKWLSFVVEQLLSNALKYTRPGGTVSIYMEAPRTLCIRDTGIGIAPEDLPRIFDMGYTGVNGRLDMRASGIGLYLCRTVCQRLGHPLTAQSRPGEGTVMRIGLEQHAATE